jgi:hypothetical protein
LNGKAYSCTTNSRYKFDELKKGQSFTVKVPAPGVKDGILAVEWKILYGHIGKTFDTSTQQGVITYLAYGSAEKGTVTLTVNPWDVVSDIPNGTWNYLYFGVRKGNKAQEGTAGWMTFEEEPNNLTFNIAPTSFVYNGKAQGPTITAIDEDKQEVSADNYTVTGTASATDVGNYTVSATAIGKYTGASPLTPWTITPATASFRLKEDTFDYDGTPKEPEVIPTPAEATFDTTADTSATEIGNYTLSASATGNYSGNNDLEWKIESGLGTVQGRAEPTPGYQEWFSPSDLEKKSVKFSN